MTEASDRAEEKAQDKADAKAAKAAADQPLAAPDIHFLQAERQSLQMNRDLLDPPKDPARVAEIKDIDAKIAAIDKQLGA